MILTLILATTLAAQPKISVTAPIEATGYTTSEAFVLTKDMKTWRCPAEYNVFVRRDVDGTKTTDKNLYYVPPHTTLTPSQGVSFAIFCVKDEVR